MKRCIFHIPYSLEGSYNVAPCVRPRKMIQGFQEIGYEVDVVMGDAKERKKAIYTVKENIKNGVKYEFVYSESSTMPTLLTGRYRVPAHPFLDFGFLKFCKRNGIKAGLFYRDIFWKFPHLLNVRGIKHFLAVLMYQYDLWQYEGLLTKFYVPSKKVARYVANPRLEKFMDELPPGAEVDGQFKRDKDGYYAARPGNERIKLFYVGGVERLYEAKKLFQTIRELEFVEMTFCCRAEEWKRVGSQYAQWLCDRIQLVHDSGRDLDAHYQNVDICLAWFKPDIYVKMAMPVKLFEYLGKTIPVIVTENTAAGEFVTGNSTGWSIEYSGEELAKLLTALHKDPSLIGEKREALMEAIDENRWASRAQKVADDLA